MYIGACGVRGIEEERLRFNPLRYFIKVGNGPISGPPLNYQRPTYRPSSQRKDAGPHPHSDENVKLRWGFSQYFTNTGRQVPIFSYYFLFFNKFLFIPIFQENSYFFLFLVMIMYFKSLNVVDHMEND